MIQAIGKKGKVIGENAPLPAVSERFALIKAMLESLGFDLPCLGSTIPGVKDILHYEELMFDPLEEESLLQKIRGFFSDRQFFDKVKILCQERKDVFLFDWKERVFEMITGTPTSLIK
jgi:glycosyltransferase involved in cell wall biosynthesis